MRIKEIVEYPRALEVEVMDPDEEGKLREFVGEIYITGEVPETPEEITRTNGEMIEEVEEVKKIVGADEKDSPEKLPKTEGFRELKNDQEEMPSIIAMKHIIETAKENGAKFFNHSMHIVYGELVPTNGCKLDRMYREVWNDLKEG